MPTISEDYNSRQTRRFKRDGVLETNVECKFTILGADDPLDEDVKLMGPQDGEQFGDGSHNLFVFERSWEVEKPQPGGIMRLLVKYGPPERLPKDNSNEPQYEFSTAGETAHIERALTSQTHYPPSANGVGDLIGVSPDKIEGVDVFVPKPSWKQTREIDNLTAAYVRILTDLSNTVNNSPWKFWQANEVLFLGVNANRKGRGKWNLDFQFSISPNTQQSILTEAGAQNFEKPGWDYMWVEKKQVASEAQVTHSVKAVHVARVYPRTNFALLGLGVTV